MISTSFENHSRMQVGPNLIMEIVDATDLERPMVVLAFYACDEKVGIPGFTVSVPLEMWNHVVRLFQKFEPNLKTA